ncbi:MAG: hypothetical protein DRJ09_01530 [Bacteroidetes bacterium]|nr:MAG: hypothetical protein DRJ09_01530 [Bacteroidota bacterium]
MKTDHAIVGVNFSKLDTPLIKYVDFLSTKIPIKTVNNLFIFTARNSFDALQKDAGKEEAERMLKSIKTKMDETITPQYKNIKHVKNYAEAGLFVQKYFHQINRKETDFVIMGKENGSHGSMNKVVVRHVPAQTLIVPELSKHKLSNIVITLDQTDFSKHILQRALDFCNLVSGKPTITCLHVGHMPSHAYLTEMFSESHQLSTREFKKIYENYSSDLKESFENFINESIINYHGTKLNIKFVGETRKPYRGLLNYIKTNETDLLIMGTKSHSLLDVMLLGSFAEKIIAKNNEVPMLVVK